MKKILNLFKIGSQRSASTAKRLHSEAPPQRSGFSLVELIIVIVIIALLSGAAYVGIQKVRSQGMNDKVLDDLIAIANAMEQYKQDNNGDYPLPTKGGSMNMNCYYADATYSHDCDEGVAAFVQGMIDNNLLTKRYLQEVPTDPRTGSRYVYGVSTDKQYFQIAGNYEEGTGYIAKTVGNLAKGYKLPSVIRAFNGPNFVVENGSNLPYSPDHMVISGTLRNINLGGGSLEINGSTDGVADGKEVSTDDEIETIGNTTVDIYFSDGSVTHLDADTRLKIQSGTKVEENDEDGIITKIRLKLFSGKIWNKVARLAQNSEFNIETTSAIAGVRGTEFGLEIDEIDPTGAGDRLLLYSGDVCRLNLPTVGIVIPAQDIKNCTISHKIANMTVDPGDPLMQGMLDTEGSLLPIFLNPDLETLMEEQTKHYLNDNMRPHILSIESGVVTIQNIKSYYDVEHDIVMDDIVVYVDGVAMDPSPVFAPDSEDNYLIDLNSGTNVTFKFKDTIYNRESGFSQPPVTITSATAMTEADLYGVEVEEVEVCEIILNSPVMTVDTMTFNWSLSGECPDGMYTIDIDCEGVVADGESDTLHHSISDADFTPWPIDGITECSWSVVSVEDASINANEDFVYTPETDPAAITCATASGYWDGTDCYTIGGIDTVVIGETAVFALFKNYTNQYDLCSTWNTGIGTFDPEANVNESEYKALAVGNVDIGCTLSSPLLGTIVRNITLDPGNYLFYTDYTDLDLNADYAASGIDDGTASSPSIVNLVAGNGLNILNGDGHYVQYSADNNFNPNKGNIEIVLDNSEIVISHTDPEFVLCDTSGGTVTSTQCTIKPLQLGRAMYLFDAQAGSNPTENRVTIYKSSDHKFYFESYADGPGNALKGAYGTGTPVPLPTSVLSANNIKITIKWGYDGTSDDLNYFNLISKIQDIDAATIFGLVKFGPSKTITSLEPSDFYIGSQVGGEVFDVNVASGDCVSAGTCKSACEGFGAIWDGSSTTTDPTVGSCYTYSQYPGYIKSVKIMSE